MYFDYVVNEKTWIMFSWSEVSKPAFCIKGVIYFRHRPPSYLRSYPPGTFDKRIILELFNKTVW
jgi:hypothetical protein